MYKLKQGVELPKEFKIKVNPEQSEALQKHLFSLGYRWGNVLNKVNHTENKYLFIRPNNLILKEFMDSKYYFKREPIPQIKFKNYFEKVEEVKKAIADLEKINLPF